jgi:hypothetical protein
MCYRPAVLVLGVPRLDFTAACGEQEQEQEQEGRRVEAASR